MADHPQLRNHLAAILLEPAVSKIDFWLEQLPVIGRELEKVACRLRSGHIRIKIDPSCALGAMYDSPIDTLVLKTSNVRGFQSLQMKSLIVHECVHALVDLNKAKDTTKLTNEAAAFLAQTIYRAAGPGGAQLQQLISGMTIQNGKNIFQEALRMVSAYGMIRKSVRLRWMMYEPLRKAINQFPGYSHYGWKELSTADGIRPIQPGGGGCNCTL